jgi:hypothetical protein
MSLSNCHNFQDFRTLAKRHLPGPIFHYIDGAADDEITYRRNTSPEIIQLAVKLYVRFPLSLRNVEDLLHERGVVGKTYLPLKRNSKIHQKALTYLTRGKNNHIKTMW